MIIYIIGPYPPPIGGISNHVYRLAYKLLECDYNIILYDDSHLPGVPLLVKLRNLILHKKIIVKTFNKEYQELNYNYPKNFGVIVYDILFKNRNKAKVIHHHKKNWKHRALLSFLTKFNSNIKLVCTIHSLRENYHDLTFFQKLYCRTTLKNTDFFIVSNQEIKDKIISWNGNNENIKIIPAFLPPIEKQSEYDKVPTNVWNFISNRNPVLTANAFMIRFFNGVDLYGIDLCVEACSKLKKVYPEVGFLFCIPEVSDEEYFEKLRRKVIELNIEENFKFVTKPIPYYQVLKKCDLFVRPTNTDGDALSIREALYYNIPSIASDVIDRPEGTILFKNRDLNDFISKISETLKNAHHNKIKLNYLNSLDNFNEIQKVYSKVTSIN